MPSEESGSESTSKEQRDSLGVERVGIREGSKQVESSKQLNATGKRAVQGIDQAKLEAARRGLSEENWYIGKVGRAHESTMLHHLAAKGERVSDLNQLIKKNMPVIDLSTDQRLVSVKGTNADSWDSQFNYLAKGFDDLYALDSKFQEKRLKAAADLASHSTELHLPADYPLPADPLNPSEAEIRAGAEYVRQRGQYCIPSDKMDRFNHEIRSRLTYNPEEYGLSSSEEVDDFLKSHVLANDLSSVEVQQLLREEADRNT